MCPGDRYRTGEVLIPCQVKRLTLPGAGSVGETQSRESLPTLPYLKVVSTR